MSIEDAKKAVDELQSVHAKFKAGSLSPVEHSRSREASLARALRALAAEHGVTLHGYLRISSGEFHIVAARPDGRDAYIHGSGEFGEAFAAILNRHNPRTGERPGAHIMAENGWCYMNHFDVERMVTEAVHALDLTSVHEAEEEQGTAHGVER